jgi:hypothetical protein
MDAILFRQPLVVAAVVMVETVAPVGALVLEKSDIAVRLHVW